MNQMVLFCHRQKSMERYPVQKYESTCLVWCCDITTRLCGQLVRLCIILTRRSLCTILCSGCTVGQCVVMTFRSVPYYMTFRRQSRHSVIMNCRTIVTRGKRVKNDTMFWLHFNPDICVRSDAYYIIFYYIDYFIYLIYLLFKTWPTAKM